MFKHLYIKNYALIELLEVDFKAGFSVITGETGAGKSIIVGAISFLLGNKTDVGVIAEGREKCIVEGVFLQDENEIIIRRELNKSGRSRFFYNDEPITVSHYRELTHWLIDLHSQHENLLLNDTSFQQKIVDNVANNGALLQNYKSTYAIWTKRKADLSELEDAAAQAKKDSDYISFQLDQLDDALLKEGELEELEQEAYQLRHCAETKKSIFDTLQLLGQDNVGVLSLLNQCNLKEVAKKIDERLTSVKIEIKDIVVELEKSYEALENDPQRLIEIEDRLNMLNSLLHKHNVKTISELIAIREEYRNNLSLIASSDEKIIQLRSELQTDESHLLDLANQLSARRQAVCKEVADYLIRDLKDLGINHANIEVQIRPLPDFTSMGRDEVRIYFSANLNQPLKMMSEVASGGEKSRLMLCIKSLMASIDDMPTLFFDEIDTGISGQVAMKMAHIMKKLARDRQVLAITHLPQIASQGTTHYKVYKQDSDNTTHTYIKMLDEGERVIEIAAMLSGDNTTQAALNSAKELL